MKKLILSLCLFCSILMYSQDRKEFAGIWQDINNDETVLVVYHDKIIKSLKFWNFKFATIPINNLITFKKNFIYPRISARGVPAHVGVHWIDNIYIHSSWSSKCRKP